jgi:hypothetical protein
LDIYICGHEFFGQFQLNLVDWLGALWMGTQQSPGSETGLSGQRHLLKKILINNLVILLMEN